MTRRVCHLTDRNIGTPYFRAIAAHHDPERYPVAMGSLEPAGTLQEQTRKVDLETFALSARGRLSYGVAIVRLAQFLRRWRAAILHAHCFDPTIVGLAAARLAGARFVFTRHHSDHNLRLGKRWHVKLDGFCARSADHVIAVSRAAREVMMTAESVPESQITVVLNGVDPPGPVPPARVAAARASLGAGPICLVPARLHEEKGHRILLEAWPAILRAAPRATLVLAGDGPERSALEWRVCESAFRETIRFLGYRTDIGDLLAASDLVVLPSLAESFGFAALDAMSMGRALVVSDAGGLPEVVQDGITGLVVPKGKAGALSDAVIQLLTNPQQAEEMGRAGREASRDFTAARMVRGYEAVYDRLG